MAYLVREGKIEQSPEDVDIVYFSVPPKIVPLLVYILIASIFVNQTVYCFSSGMFCTPKDTNIVSNMPQTP